MLKETGTNAGIIWQYIDTNGQCSTIELQKRLKMNDKEFFMALGWLSREDKIDFYEKEETEYIFIKY
jgi:hypothetical protein